MTTLESSGQYETVAGMTGAGFGDLLRQLRAAAGMTQEELAGVAGLSPRSISDLERGVNRTARKDTARLLAEALGLQGATRAAFEEAARGGAARHGSQPHAGWPGQGAAATRTLPRDIASFTGREAELSMIASSAVTDAVERGRMSGIHAIDGMAGVGKTTLAVHAAHQLAERFPDGQFFLSLHAHTPGQQPVDPADALASLLLTVGMPASQIPDDLESRMARWRDHLAGKLLLLVLDDAAGHEQVRPLLPGSGGSLVLVTSRRHLTALEDASTTSLDILPPGQAAALLVRLAGRADVRPDDSSVAQVIQLSGCLPLAIGMLARQLHHHPAWTAADLVTDLVQARDRLELMRAENLSVAAAFDLSYADLTPGLQRLFRCLGLHPGPEADAYAAAALAGLDVAEARRGLAGLYDHHLVTEPAHGRYRLHDLLREHARSLAAAHSEQDDEQSMSRLLEYYERGARSADILLSRLSRPGAAQVPWPGTAKGGSASVAVPDFPDRGAAQAWLTIERANLLACVSQAVCDDSPQRVIGLVAALAEHLRNHGPLTRALELHGVAASAARRAGDRMGEASALVDLADALNLTGDYSRATEHLERASGIYHELGDQLGRANASYEYAETQRLTSDYSGATRSVQQALDMYRKLGDRRGQAYALLLLGKLRIITDDYKGAMEVLENARAISRSLGDERGNAEALCELGIARYAIDDYPGAISALEASLSIKRDLGEQLGQAFALLQLGVIRWATDDYPGAMSVLEQALGLYDSLGNRIGLANVRCNTGTVHMLRGDYHCALRDLEQALAIYEDLGHRLGQGHALTDLGAIRRQAGDLPGATKVINQALRIYRDIGHAHGESSALAELGAVLYRTGDYAGALELLESSTAICRELGDRVGEAHALNHAGPAWLARGNTARALSSHQRALEIARAIRSPLAQARALEGIASCQSATGDAESGRSALRQALEIYQRIGAPDGPRLARTFAADA